MSIGCSHSLINFNHNHMISYITPSCILFALLSSISMAAENSMICLLGTMDRLWFHQIILFSDPSLILVPKTPMTVFPYADSPKDSSECDSETSFITNQESSGISEKTASQDELSIPESETETTPKERLSTWSCSSSRSVERYQRNLRGLGSGMRLQKTMSCKSLGELELEEVKGFMDLGFVFEKDKVSKRMMSLIPGLQRLEESESEERDVFYDDENENEDEDEGSRRIKRPYLLESWLIRRPDSPLLNLRVPMSSTAADMKKHLKYWARTVASYIQQES